MATTTQRLSMDTSYGYGYIDWEIVTNDTNVIIRPKNSYMSNKSAGYSGRGESWLSNVLSPSGYIDLSGEDGKPYYDDRKCNALLSDYSEAMWPGGFNDWYTKPGGYDNANYTTFLEYVIVDTPYVYPYTRSDSKTYPDSVECRRTINRTHSNQTFYLRFQWKLSGGETVTTHKAITVPALAQYVVSYNANGGSGSMSNSTKWHGEQLLLSQNAFAYDGFTFDHWNTQPDDTGTSYTTSLPADVNAETTLYAIWKHSVSYNANGGDNPPATQSALKSESITITSATPGKTNYRFAKWNTSNDGTGEDYDPGDTIPANTPNMVLCAIWEYYRQPAITSLDIVRCDSEGDFSPNGTYMKATVQWRITPWHTYTNPASLNIKILDGTTQVATDTEDEFMSAESGLDRIGTTVMFFEGPFDVTKQYAVQVKLEDVLSSVTVSGILTKAFYPIAIHHSGSGIAFGKPAVADKCLIGYDTEVDGTINCTSLTQTSDKRAKKHLKYLGEEAAEMIDALEPALFMHEGKRLMGFYAQDVQEADVYESDIVSDGPGAYLSLNYTALLAPIVAYIQMLEERIVELENDYEDDEED